MSLVSTLPAVVDDSALEKSNGRSVRLLEEQSGMQVDVVTSAPLVAVRFGRNGVGHVPGIRKDAGAEQICDYLLVVETGAETHAVLVELKKTWQSKAREQLRRSLPVLDYLRSACEVERQAPHDETRISTGYLVVCEKRRLNKQPPKLKGHKLIHSEEYRNIQIRTYVGTTISLAVLTGAPSPAVR